MPTTKKELDDARDAAAAQELEATGGDFIAVPLTGDGDVIKEVRTRPANKWRASAMRCLRQGDVDGFMEKVLHEDDFEIYEDLDPDQDGFQQFCEDAAQLSGEALGKSGGRTRSGSSTRRS